MPRWLLMSAFSVLAVGVPGWADDKGDTLKAASEFCYPKTETGNNYTAGRATVIVTATPDDFDKVVEWYETKNGAKTFRRDGKIPLSGGNAGGGGPADRVNEWRIIVHDSEGEKGKPRAVRSTQFLRETKTHLLSVAITRANAEDKTHVIVTYIGLGTK